MNGADKPDEILGYLASLPDADPPAALFQRVRAATRPGAGPGAAESPTRGPRARSRRHRRWLFATAASVLVLVGVAGALQVRSDLGPATAPEVPVLTNQPGDPGAIHAEIRAIDRRLQRRLADDASDDELRSLWRERAVLAELLDQPDAPYQPTRI